MPVNYLVLCFRALRAILQMKMTLCSFVRFFEINFLFYTATRCLSREKEIAKKKIEILIGPPGMMPLLLKKPLS